MIVAKTQLRRAFTLLEVMLAMAIFTVVLVAIYSSWVAIVRGSKTGLKAAAAAQRSRIAMRAIEDALLTTQVYTENSRYYSFIADTSDPKLGWLSLTAQLPANFPGSGLFGDLTVRRVTFSVEQDVDGTKQLVMTQIPYLLVTNSEVSAYPITLAKDVSLFVLEFWDAQLNDWTDELLTTNQIPKMVRISLGVGHVTASSKPIDVTSRIVAMPSIAVGQAVQQPIRQTGTGGAGGGQGNGGRGNSGGGRDGNNNGFPGSGGNGRPLPGGQKPQNGRPFKPL
ncbi:MAG: type II secretion system protein [Verrucomicrobiota bacterium]